ncbi:MAG: PQQ-binding-like beta-propeller repeat protein [Phycisphaeraceae bacterium]
MSGRNQWRIGRLIRFGLVLGVMGAGSMTFGVEIRMQQQAFGWRCGVGQQFIQPIQQAPREQTQDGFNVAASGTAIEDTPAGEALKLIEQGQWIKAIQAIESLDDTDQQLVLDANGVLRPLSAMKSAMIASMPEAGRRTFCKLNDPAANTRLAEALDANDFNEREQSLKSIVDSYALCDAAATAAEHLGDIRFEQGRFNEAAAYYQFASEHPATTADDAGLMVRRLTALSRAEQWSAFDVLAEYAKFRYPQTTMTIAGQDTPIQGFIATLAEGRDAVPTLPGDGSPTRLVLPNVGELEYDQPMIAKDHLRLLQMHAQNNNLRSIIDQIIAPIVASDHDRLFTLTLGSVARLNPETGTELWRVGDANQTVQKLSKRMHNLTAGYHQSLVVHDDTVLASLPGERHDFNAYLTALNADNGEVRWTLKDIQRNNNESVVGQPIVLDSLVYFVTYRSTMELTLRVVNLDDGSEVNTLALGKASKGPYVNAPAELSPRLTMGQSHLMVQTNNGALIAVDPNEMKIAWAFTQKVRQSGVGMMRRNGVAVANAVARHTGDVAAKDGLVIAKDTRTNQVVAFREYDAAMLWSAESDGDSTIVHQDDAHVYVLGKELVALDRRTGERVWWTPHPGDKSGLPVFTDDACLIAGNRRLCRIDLRTGKLTHYREDMTHAAALHVVGNRLISVDQNRIAAIALP